MINLPSQFENMMKNTYTFILFLLLTVYAVYAHKVLLMVEDNENGTISIEAGLSTGGSIKGAKVVLKDKSTGQPLLQKEMPESGKLTVDIPVVPYTVTLEMGKEHTITKTGPYKKKIEHGIKDSARIMIENGFESNSVSETKKKPSIYSRLLMILSIVGIVFIFGVLYGVLKVKKQ